MHDYISQLIVNVSDQMPGKKLCNSFQLLRGHLNKMISSQLITELYDLHHHYSVNMHLSMV